MKFATSLGLAAALAFAVGVNAQETQSKTQTKIEGAKDMVTYTGCVATAGETHSYVLEKVVPVSQTRTTEVTGTGGTVTTTSTTYALVPEEKVDLQPHVGHKVEVTGIIIPAGESKVHTETKIEREHGKDVKIDSKAKSDTDRPTLHVLSVKHLDEPCM
jgi:hypothetical protein